MGRLVASLLCVVVVVGLGSGSAAAHEAGTTAIELTLDGDTVGVELDLPVAELGAALDTELPTDAIGLSQQREMVVDYVADHLAVGGGDVEWPEAYGTLTAVAVDGVEHLRLAVELDVGGDIGEAVFVEYDAIIEADASHRAIVTVVDDGGTGVAGVLDADTSSLTVVEGTADAVAATVSVMAAEGFDHVLDGADHMLFLVVLLLPAPLVATGRRWQPGPNWRRAMWRVVHVASAFTIGHSLTLMASALGWVALPSRPVEILIAASVAVGAVHALRPLARRGEVGIAAGFGLIHGLAFAGILDDLALSESASLLSLLGFNVGIELAQLAIIAVTFPSMWALSRTRAYTAARVAGAGIALVAAAGWTGERLGVSDNPLSTVEATVVDHGTVAVALLATLAAFVVAADRVSARAVRQA